MRTPVAFLGLLAFCGLVYRINGDWGRSIFVFGDSLSDTGNLLTLTNGALPAPVANYYKGEFSNGPIWVNAIANMTKLPAYSYAVGGAKACSTATVLTNVSVPTAAQQYASFKAEVNSRYTTTVANRIITIWIGNNEILSSNYVSAVSSGSQATLVAYLNNTVACILQTTQQALSAHEKKVVVMGLAAIELSPYALAYPSLMPTIKDSVDYINEAVQASLPLLNKTAGAKVIFFNSATLVRDVIANYQANKFTNVTSTCLVTNPGQSLSSSNAFVSVCPMPDDYFFYDIVHPSSHAHAILAKNVTSVLKKKKWVQ